MSYVHFAASSLREPFDPRSGNRTRIPACMICGLFRDRRGKALHGFARRRKRVDASFYDVPMLKALGKLRFTKQVVVVWLKHVEVGRFLDEHVYRGDSAGL